MTLSTTVNFGFFRDCLESVLGIVDGVQTEIIVFFIAVVAHTLLFGNHWVVSKESPIGKLGSSPKAQKLPQERARSPVAMKSCMKMALVDAKAALGTSNLENALSSLKSASGSLKASHPVAPRGLVRQLLRLASEQSKLPLLLDELAGSDALLAWAAEPLLQEACSLRLREVLDAMRERAKSRSLRLPASTYCSLIRGARLGFEAREAFAEALEKGACSEDVLSAAAEAAAALEDGALAAEAIGHVPEKPSPELGSSMVHLVAKGLVTGQSVLQLFESKLMGVDLLFDGRAAKCVAEAAIQAKRPDLLRTLLAASAGSRQVSLLRRFGAEKQLGCAEEVFKACPEQMACLHNALLDVYVGAGEMALAEGVMVKAAKAGLVDVITYNTMIKAHLRNRDIRRARASVETMRSVGLTPDRVTFNELVDAAFKSDPTAVWDLVDEMKACGLKPNQVTCSIMLKNVNRSSSASDVRRTLSMLNAMGEVMDEVLLSSICEACIRASQRDLLREQLKRLRGLGAITVRGPHTFGSIIRAHGFVQDLEGVWATWREMFRRRILPTSITLGCMVEALVSNDGPGAGYEMIRDMLGRPSTRPLVNAVIYCSVLKGLVQRRQFDRLWEIYAEMQANMRALQFSVATYNLLIDACARSCDMARVPALLKEMSGQHIEPNVITFSTIVKGYCQGNQVDEAFDLLEDMKRGKNTKPDEITYNSLLDGCARHGMLDRGLALLQDMQDACVPPSNFTLSVLVKLASRSFRLEKAFQLCTDISKKYRLKPNVHVYNNLISACIQHKEIDRAVDVFKQSIEERVRPDVRTYTLLAGALLTDGDPLGAAGLLRAAYGLADVHPAAARAEPKLLQVRGGLPSDALAQILEGVARAGERAAVRKLVADLRRSPSVKLDPRLALRLISQVGGHN